MFWGGKYSLIGMTAGRLATPEQFGMVPAMLHTACYRGFYATYELTGHALYLRELTLRAENGFYLPIGETLPDENTERFQAHYSGLKVLVPFTGKIRLAKGFIRDLYIHMGYQKPTAFETVLDITLKTGEIMEIKDRSQEMEEMRGAFKRYYESGDMFRTIEDAFSLDMDLE